MALKSVFNAMKREGYVIKDLDLYLLSLNGEDNDRAIDVNAPSQIGGCLRSRYYSRTQASRDTNAVDARTRRIFDNGTKTHERLQQYLEEQGMLLMDEVPVYNATYNIQGHTDGILALGAVEKGVLEIKSINSNGFSNLKTVKEEHRKQGLTYVYCLEQRRLELHEIYSSLSDFVKDKKNNLTFKLGDIFQKEMIIDENGDVKELSYIKVNSLIPLSSDEFNNDDYFLNDKMDSILMETRVPITKAIFLYENKDSQELKEFCVSTREAASQEVLKEILNECSYINDCIKNGIVPPRCSNSKTSSPCRFCPFTIECFN